MTRRTDLQRKALDEPRLTLDDLAKAAKVSRSSVEKYRLPSDSPDRQPMPAEVARLLGRYLRKQSARLARLADELEDLSR
jgi:hypothetical protein